MAVENLVGKTINELTILEQFYKGNKIYYKARCSCGNIIEVRRDSVVSGNTKSCGHLKDLSLIDFTGQKFGRLTAIKKVDGDKRYCYWLCKCDCGNEKIVKISNLKNGIIKSCGCLLEEILQKDISNKVKEKYVENTNLNNISNTELRSDNKSGVTGVHWCNKRNKWVAQIVVQKKSIYLGQFSEKSKAIKARKDAEEKYFKPILEKYKDEL